MKKQWFKKTFASNQVVKLIQQIAKVFAKLPHLPQGLIRIIVKIMPIFSLVLGLISLLAALSNISSLVLSVANQDLRSVLSSIFNSIIILLNSVLLLKSVKLLKKEDAIGWIYVFWTQVINVIYIIIDIIGGQANLWWAGVNLLLPSYLLFEIGPSYGYSATPSTPESSSNPKR